MTVIEFLTVYGDWYLFIGVMCASRYTPFRVKGLGRPLAFVYFFWDVLFWPGDIMRNLWLLKE